MPLTQCPECAGKIGSRAFLCPHCGFPLLPAASKYTGRQSRKRRPNGSGTVVKMSGRRKNPYQVRVNTHINEDGYRAVYGDIMAYVKEPQKEV